jgi:ribosomal-protein-alanine N-acetyltransferase
VALSIRESRRADFTQLWRIDQECFPPGISYSRAELAHYMARRGTFTLVAEATREDRPQIVGFAVAECARRELGHIITIDVLPPFRRAGAGSRLMGAAEERLRRLGCRAVYLETSVDNLTALAFYKRHGYSVLRTIPGYYMGKVDALLIGKRL